MRKNSKIWLARCETFSSIINFFSSLLLHSSWIIEANKWKPWGRRCCIIIIVPNGGMDCSSPSLTSISPSQVLCTRWWVDNNLLLDSLYPIAHRWAHSVDWWSFLTEMWESTSAFLIAAAFHVHQFTIEKIWPKTFLFYFIPHRSHSVWIWTLYILFFCLFYSLVQHQNVSLLVILLYAWQIHVNTKKQQVLGDVYYGVQIAYFAIIGSQLSILALSVLLIIGINNVSTSDKH